MNQELLGSQCDSGTVNKKPRMISLLVCALATVVNVEKDNPVFQDKIESDFELSHSAKNVYEQLHISMIFAILAC